MSSPLLSLIFVNYQSAGSLAQAIDSWKEPLRDFAYEVIVINNDVSENANVTEFFHRQAVRIENVGRNIGFGAASNRGAALAQGEWLFFLNPDTNYFSGNLTALLPIFSAYPNSLGGIRLLTPLGTGEAWSSGSFPTLVTLVAQHLFGQPKNASWEYRSFAELDWVSGAALIASRTAFETLGGFDEAFFLYFEDVDLARRAHELGIPVWYSPSLVVEHVGGASHSNRRIQKQAYYQSEQLYFKKYRPLWETTCLRFLHRALFHTL